MTSPDSIYTSPPIGPFSNNTVVDYAVEAWDDVPTSARRPSAGFYDFRVGLHTIYQIQYVAKGGDTTAFYGEPVNVAGIVTAAPGEYSDHYFYIQNSYTAEKPEFYGVMVYEGSGTVDVARGDSITVSGDADEYLGMTEIGMFFPEAITVHSSGNPIPGPYPVTTGMIDSTEAWEGVFVVVDGPTVTDPDVGYGEWEMSNTTPDTASHVGNDAYYLYEPTLDENLLAVRGIVRHAFGTYMLEPRDDDDICQTAEAGVGGELRVPKTLAMMLKPNPMLDGGTVRFSVPSSGPAALKVYNVRGQIVKTLLDGHIEAGTHKMNWNGTNARGSKVSSGIYFIRLETNRGSLVKKAVVSR
jgi:hypothetical protein